ncbi:MAG TPA: hypothetical protein VFK05_01510 [Polyangiaceae bacterium]|nr:hypothetical protein [Polyangiaceae bacterium]
MKVAVRRIREGALVSLLALTAGGCGGREVALDPRYTAGAPASASAGTTTSSREDAPAFGTGGSGTGPGTADPTGKPAPQPSGGAPAFSSGNGAAPAISAGSGGQLSGGAFGSGGYGAMPAASAGFGGYNLGGVSGVSGSGSNTPIVEDGRQLMVLAEAKEPVSVAAYDGKAYYADFGSFNNDGSVAGVDQSGKPLFRLDQLQGPGGIAANAGGVYWTAYPNLNHANLDGSNITTLSNTFVNDPIALGANGVYGTGSGSDVGSGTAPLSIVGVGLSGGATLPIASTPHASYGLATDADNVYWTTFSDPMSILKAPLVPSSAELAAPTVLATSPGPGGNIAVDAHNVYWVAHGTVMKVPVGGGTATPLASASPSGFIPGIAVDGTYVYWSTADGILKVSVDGGTPEVLVSGLDTPSCIALDETSVYFAIMGTPPGQHGTIARLWPK